MNLKELEYAMRTLKFAGWAAALVMAVCLTAGAARAEEKKLTMYVAYGGPEVIAQQFEAATGIKVEFLTMSSGEVLTRLRAEKSNPGADVWFGGGVRRLHPGQEGRADRVVQGPPTPAAWTRPSRTRTATGPVSLWWWSDFWPTPTG